MTSVIGMPGETRASGSEKRQKPRGHHRVLAVWMWAVLVFLWAPLLVVVAFSFNGSSISSLPMRGFTLDWYSQVFQDPTLAQALRNSFKVAFAVVVSSTLLGTMAAIGLHGFARRFKGIITGLVIIPVMTPALIVGIGLLSLFNTAGVRLSLTTVIASHVVVTMPYVVLIVSARLVGFDDSLEEAASDLGAGKLIFLRRILLPLLMPGIVAGALLAFTLSFDEIVVTFFTIGNQNTLPMFIWGLLRTGITPEVNALSTLLILASIIVAIVAERLLRTDIRRGHKTPTQKESN